MTKKEKEQALFDKDVMSAYGVLLDAIHVVSERYTRNFEIAVLTKLRDEIDKSIEVSERVKTMSATSIAKRIEEEVKK